MSAPLAILALDLSSHTGWAIRRRDGSVASGVEHFSRVEEGPGVVYPRFREWVRSLATTTESRTEKHGAMSVERVAHAPSVDVIAWEQVVVRHRTASMLYVLEAQVVEVAHKLGLAVVTVGPGTLKAHATGKKTAKKPEMIAAAVNRWGSSGSDVLRGGDPDDNEADALCVLGWAIDTHEVTT